MRDVHHSRLASSAAWNIVCEIRLPLRKGQRAAEQVRSRESAVHSQGTADTILARPARDRPIYESADNTSSGIGCSVLQHGARFDDSRTLREIGRESPTASAY